MIELLKQPLQTQVSLSTMELDDYHFEEGVHIHIPLRDFKVLLTPKRF
jgi:Rad9